MSISTIHSPALNRNQQLLYSVTEANCKQRTCSYLSNDLHHEQGGHHIGIFDFVFPLYPGKCTTLWLVSFLAISPSARLPTSPPSTVPTTIPADPKRDLFLPMYVHIPQLHIDMWLQKQNQSRYRSQFQVSCASQQNSSEIDRQGDNLYRHQRHFAVSLQHH